MTSTPRDTAPRSHSLLSANIEVAFEVTCADKLDPHAVGGSFPDGDQRFDAAQLRLRIDVGVAADRSRVMPAIASATEADHRVRSSGTQRRQSPDGLGLDEVLAIIR
jgi:hypothetical protein